MSHLAKLYVVATPIGNLEDITVRALSVLKTVDLIAAEDTRQSKKLLMHYGIEKPLFALHAHNEEKAGLRLLEALKKNQNVAYITDAGTPLISDPGAKLVQLVRAEGFDIIPIPGPCAAITALSVAGFVHPQFYFEGFLPHKQTTRMKKLNQLKSMSATLIFYESTHRITETLQDMVTIFGNIEAVVGRELTKKFETILSGSLETLLDTILLNNEQRLGEFVILLSPNPQPSDKMSSKAVTVLTLLLAQLPLKGAVNIASQVLEMKKNDLYALAIELSK